MPGGPTRSTPLGILPPSFWNFGGSLRNSMISRSSSLASSTPATSWKVTLFCFSEMRRARALPKDRALAPPPCIWRMKKIHTPMKSSMGTHCRKIGEVGRIAVDRLDGDADAAVLERLDEVRIVRGRCVRNDSPLASFAAHRVAARGVTSRTSPASTFFRKSEKTISSRGDSLAWKRLNEEDDDEADHHPQGEILVEGIHGAKVYHRPRCVVRRGPPPAPASLGPASPTWRDQTLDTAPSMGLARAWAAGPERTTQAARARPARILQARQKSRRARAGVSPRESRAASARDACTAPRGHASRSTARAPVPPGPPRSPTAAPARAGRRSPLPRARRETRTGRPGRRDRRPGPAARGPGPWRARGNLGVEGAALDRPEIPHRSARAREHREQRSALKNRRWVASSRPSGR
mgnify:CR=1 FL=1